MRFLRATRLPLYRQEQMWARWCVELSRKTMGGWMAQSAALLEPLYRWRTPGALENWIS